MSIVKHQISFLPPHVLQSSEWGMFRQKTGLTVLRPAPGFQLTVHPIPKIPFTIGYVAKCALPTKEVVKELIKIGKQHRCIFVKLEPNVIKKQHFQLSAFSFQLIRSPHPNFHLYTFMIDLSLSEKELLNKMKPKTRYNIKIAQKYGVVVRDETNNPEAFEHYINLSKETWTRQKFHGHGERYHRLMWETLQPPGIAHLLVAYYNPKSHQSDFKHPTSPVKLLTSNFKLPLVAWILFLYKDVLYYPYGASSNKHKNVMASTLMMWEAMKWGKKHNAKHFDLWGCLCPDPDTNHPWYGFHRFKEGFGGELVEFMGSYDLVINPILYNIYNILHPIRQQLLKLTK